MKLLLISLLLMVVYGSKCAYDFYEEIKQPELNIVCDSPYFRSN